MKHVDGGLINSKNASQVIAAVQALLHSSSMVEFLLGDDNHHKTCRSLLQCLLCTVRRVYDEMAMKGFGDPSPLVRKWQGVSSRMTLEQQNSPLQVLNVFIDILRFQHMSRDPKSFKVENAMTSHPLSKIWCSTASVDISCSSCGQFNYLRQISDVTLSDIVVDVGKSIINALLTQKEELCTKCKRQLASVTNIDVMLAESLIVHVDRLPNEFSLPLEQELQGYRLSLRCLIAQQQGKPCVFVAMCPDGTYRKFEDTKISKISPAKLCTSEFIRQSKLTFIFEERKGALPRKVNVVKSSNCGTSMKKSTVKVVGFPKLSTLDLSSLEISSNGASDHQEYRRVSMQDACTQTCKSVKDSAVQTGPYVSFEFCKHNKQFKFFTGISLEDFYALYDLIGGHKVIRTLKLDYDAKTPVKLRPTKLSSEDKLYMFLLRLRRGLALEELSEIFHLSPAMLGKLFYAVMRLIYLTFKSMEEEMFITAEQQRKHKPKKMLPFPNLRVLLDGVSFHLETPSNFEQQGATYSTYKSDNVMLFSVGIACNGATIFCSDGMEGRMSDKEVILKSGLLDRLSKGDSVMTDRGYEITAELQAIGCTFYKPPSQGDDRLELTPEEEILTKAIASARIYTEHAMADIKDNGLLRGTLPLTMLPILGDLVYIAAYLRNFNPCRIHDRRFVVEERNRDDSQFNISDLHSNNTLHAENDITLNDESEINETW